MEAAATDLHRQRNRDSTGK
ncbi:BnaA05g15750D [Brassica napus]|uniref:BnaA05g15750D protein n=1 Tax=Brassica napus TaxID=3708 RepID=A0A078GT13_BRANA|nr:BnaA05g15750D [Brassica napus]